MIKVFEMDDCTWYAGESSESVTAKYLTEGGDGYDDADPPVELSEETLKRLTFSDVSGPVIVKRSFREELDRMIAAGKEFPCFFATTEF